MAKAMKIDFSGTEKEIRRGGKAAHIPEGDYLFKVVKHETRKNKAGTGRYFSWQMQCVSKKYKGKTIYHITSLKPDALWNLRNLIHACLGRNVAGKVVNFDPTSLYGKIFAGTTEDDEYENEETHKVTIKSVLADLRPKEELEADEEDDDDETDDDEDEDEDEEEDDEDDEEEDEDDEDEEEDEEPPARKKRSAKPSSAGGKKKKSKARKSRDDDEDLEDVDVEDI